MKNRIACFALCILFCAALYGCMPQGGTSSVTASPSAVSSSAASQNDTEADIRRTLEMLQNTATLRPVDADFLRWGCDTVDPAFAAKLADTLEKNPYYDDLFFKLFGGTLIVLHDFYTAAPEIADNIHLLPAAASPPVLAFTGDVNLSDTWETMLFLEQQPNGIKDCISPALLAKMQQADILLINNEFPFSNRGSPLPGKLYTFRAKTENVEILHEMGADIVSLGNNHVFDYGEDAFFDTLDTLQNAGIPYVGAGRNVDEAAKPQYFILGGMKVAYVAASRAEKYILTPEATKTQPGVLRCYDPALFRAAVTEARANADVVIAYPHWGTENSYVLEDVQITLGQALIDAGADMVVGAHPHNLQGIDFYNGKPVVYSLGNFWFNTSTVDTALLEITLNAPGEVSVTVQPCLQKGGVTSLLEEEPARQRLFDLLVSISPNPISITPDGLVTETDADSSAE